MITYWRHIRCPLATPTLIHLACALRGSTSQERSCSLEALRDDLLNWGPVRQMRPGRIAIVCLSFNIQLLWISEIVRHVCMLHCVCVCVFVYLCVCVSVCVVAAGAGMPIFSSACLAFKWL